MAWCHFRDEGEALCLLQAGALSAYTLAGELQGVPLPPGFTAMWALPQGLLLAVRAQEPCAKKPCRPARAWVLPRGLQLAVRAPADLTPHLTPYA